MSTYVCLQEESFLAIVTTILIYLFEMSFVGDCISFRSIHTERHTHICRSSQHAPATVNDRVTVFITFCSRIDVEKRCQEDTATNRFRATLVRIG